MAVGKCLKEKKEKKKIMHFLEFLYLLYILLFRDFFFFNRMIMLCEERKVFEWRSSKLLVLSQK